MELESVKKQSANTLATLTQIENSFYNRLSQIENRFVHLEGPQNKPNSRKRYDDDDDYYYGPEY